MKKQISRVVCKGLLVAAAVAFALPAAADGGLKVGEYACYGSGGSVLIGAGFKVIDDSHYTDLDDTTSGTYAVDGDKVTFTDGHLDGETGRGLRDGKFILHEGVSCEPF